jgi:TfoX-like protein
MKNLGRVSKRMLADIGVTTPAGLREIGSVEAFLRLKYTTEHRVSLNALYAMEAALLDVHWRHLPAARKAEIRAAVSS